MDWGGYQGDAGNVEHKGNERISEEKAEADARHVLRVEVWNLGEESDDKVHGGADGGIVVEADEGIHLKPLAAQHDLNHDDPDGLDSDAANLVEKADEGKLNLAKRGEGDAGDDDEDVEKGGEVGVGDAPGPRGEEDGDGGGRLEHLDKGDGEIEVDEVGEDEGGRVEDADGPDCAQIEARRHGDAVARVEERRGAGEDLGGQGGEEEVPAGEEDCWEEVSSRGGGGSEKTNGILQTRSIEVSRCSSLISSLKRGSLTKASSVEDPFVKENGGVGEEDPGPVVPRFHPSVNMLLLEEQGKRAVIRNIEGRMQAL